MKKYSLLVSLLLSGIIIFGFQNCKKEHLPDPQICFQEDVLPLMVSSCTQSGCHNPYDLKKGYDFSNYEGIVKAVKKGDYRASKLYKSIISESADRIPQKPYPALTDEQVKTVALWIEQGALNNLSCHSACDTTMARYSAEVKPVLNKYCSGYHGNSPYQGGIKLSGYNDVVQYAQNGRLLGSIKFEPTFSPMTKNSNQIPQCKIDIIEKWIKEGAQNN